MLPLKFIRQNQEAVRRGMQSKGAAEDGLDKLLDLDAQVRKKISRVENLKAQRNQASQEIGQRKQAGKAAEGEIAAMGDLSLQIKALDQEIHQLQEQLHQHLLWIPNLPHPLVPVGSDPSHNRVVCTVGEAVRPAVEAGHPLDLLTLL